ncbi:hypothetical protein SAMN00808754_3266 [Thermanaeromonas toyohensis ToBE]|uniref:Prenylated flavin chaperone LpdD-like domain-containing protein n=1 Tax=Thermanaeromonas toyohensis ToBE TaxID=698762 RepID=A0A1W1W375_9FIRM|nr:hypothetical protein [Thermanaeromonas toyohensis]SMC00079.1 hypothetical protein SAMN00808754_3266 [Thermanaeromonas toyohensis ToBE]
MITCWVGKGRFRVFCRLFLTQGGIVAHIFGGERPHVGAVALAVPRPSLEGTGRTSSTASVLTVVGHKDDELARPVALLLAARLGVPAVVVAGVHVDGASRRDIAELVRNSWRAVRGALGVWRRVLFPGP